MSRMTRLARTGSACQRERYCHTGELPQPLAVANLERVVLHPTVASVMSKPTETSGSLAFEVDNGQDDRVSEAKHPQVKAGISLSWPPPRVGRSTTPPTQVGDWGQVRYRPPTETRPADIMIEFKPHSLRARRMAFEFAQTLIARIADEVPHSSARFVSAEDHYHVIVERFVSPQHKIAEGIARSFENGAWLSGGQIGRSGFDEHEHRNEVTGEFTIRRRKRR